MLLYADSANIALLKKMDELGVLSGMTTNPAILAGEPSPPTETITKLCQEFPAYPVFAQANAKTCDGMVEMAAAYAAISPQIVIKIPACVEGFKALTRIRREKLFDNQVCITTVTTAAQALLACAAGADYVAPYVGDVDGIGYSGMEALGTMVAVLAGTGVKVVAAATERAQDMVTAAELGADIATVTPQAALAVLEKPYPITKWYLDLFEEAAKG